ncbi:MAG TPA: hypothetical protein DIW61_01230 [Candidatus Aminicenantes bacterium]|nr:hypothetical protein [Candidatus Aminicenantes bacterium]
MSQKNLAHLIGIDASTIGAWEKRKSRPLKTNLIKLISMLDSKTLRP